MADSMSSGNFPPREKMFLNLAFNGLPCPRECGTDVNFNMWRRCGGVQVQALLWTFLEGIVSGSFRTWKKRPVVPRGLFVYFWTLFCFGICKL